MVVSTSRNGYFTCTPVLCGRYHGATTGPGDVASHSDGERRTFGHSLPRGFTVPVRASGQVAEGVDPREAWKRCDKPKGEAGIQNIRKAGFKLRKLGTVAPKQPSAAEPPTLVKQ